MSSEQDRESLKKLLIERAFEKRDIVLTSGLKSDWYIDGKQATLHPMGLKLVGELIFDRLRGAGIEAVGGPTMGADPIVTATAWSAISTVSPWRPSLSGKSPSFMGRAHGLKGRTICGKG